jgi:hypothetical protein
MSKGHYKRQLDRIDTKNQYAPTFQFKSMGGDTQWMSLNQDSANELREWLDEQFPPQMIKLEEVEDKKSF